MSRPTPGHEAAGDHPEDLITSSMQPVHQRLGARFAPFGGWSMPLEYAGGGILAEHQAVRERVGVFDVSHLGTLLVTGPGAAEHLNTQLSNDLRRIAPGQAQYTLLCTPQGGVQDDLIAYLISPEQVLLIPNAANCAAVAQVLSAAAPAGVEVRNVHRDYAIIAVQGPRSADLLTVLGLPTGMDYMSFRTVQQPGWTMTVCRTGYTGELGYELVLPAEQAPGLLEAVLAAGEQWQLLPCGLGARDTLRTEMGYPLHGQDLTPQINPVEAGLGWAVGWGKAQFRGAEALRLVKEQGPTRRARGLRAVGAGIPRPGMTVVELEDGAELGVLTSGTYSPSLRTGIGLALLAPHLQPGDRVGVRVRTRTEPFELVKPPFLTPEVRTPASS